MNSNKPKSEIEWEKEFNIIFGEMLLVAMGGGDIGIGKTVIKDLIKRTLVQSRQQFAEEINLIIDNEIKKWQGHGEPITNIAGGVMSALKTLKDKLIK